MTNQSVMTPRKSGVGPLQNFVSLDAPESNVRSSRDAIKGELANKLIFDDPRVFDRYLGIVEVPSPLVDACADNFEAANHHAIGQLQMIIGAANPRSLDDLEALERDDEGVQRKVKREERKMYPHLVFPRNFQLFLPYS
jgi:hypothetical protein